MAVAVRSGVQADQRRQHGESRESHDYLAMGMMRAPTVGFSAEQTVIARLGDPKSDLHMRSSRWIDFQDNQANEGWLKLYVTTKALPLKERVYCIH